MIDTKPSFATEFSESNGESDTSNARRARLIDSVRISLMALTFLVAATILGTSSDVLAVYNQTHVPQSYQLALWPFDFNPGPTISLVAGSSVIVASSIVSLVASKASFLQPKALIRTIVMAFAPLVGLIAALIAMSFFYAINTSTTTETLQSWSCRWSSLDMPDPPHFQALCQESETALYMMIAIIPLQLILLGITAFEFIVEKKNPVIAEQKGSPAMS